MKLAGWWLSEMFPLIYHLIKSNASPPIKQKCSEAHECVQVISVIWRVGFTQPRQLVHAWQILIWERQSVDILLSNRNMKVIISPLSSSVSPSCSLIYHCTSAPCWEFPCCSNLEKLWFDGTTPPSQQDRGALVLTWQASIMVFEL